MNEFHIGDAFFQLVVIGIFMMLVFMVVKSIRSFVKRNSQLNRIEEKMDTLLEEKGRK